MSTLSSAPRKERSVWLGFLPMAIATFVMCFSAGVFIPVPAQLVLDMGRAYSDTTWTALVYPMGAAACAPIMGKLCDIIGSRKTLLVGMVILACGYLLGAMAPSFWIVVFSRFVSGLGAAAVAPVCMAYIATKFPREKTGKGFAVYTLINCISVIIGPSVGGLLIHAFNWRAPMFWASAAGVIAFVLCFILCDRTPHERKNMGNFDFVGAALVFVLFSAILLIPSIGQTGGWTSPAALGLIVLAIVLVFALRLVEKKAQSPILSLGFMARKSFILPVIILFLTQGLMQANMTMVIIFARMVDPADSLVSSFAVSVLYIGMSIGSVVMGPLADKKEPKLVAAISLVITGLGAAITYFFSAGSTFPIYAASLGLIGLGLGGQGPVFMKVVLSGLPPEIAGTSSGSYSVFRSVASPFGVAVFVPLFSLTAAANAAKLIAGGAEQAAAAVAGGVASAQMVTTIELVCVALGVVLSLMLPSIHKGAAKTQKS